MFEKMLILLFMIISILISSFRTKKCQHKIDKIDKIVDNVYLGNWFDSIDEKKLRCNNIKCILTLNYFNSHNYENIRMFNQLGIRYKYIKIHDSLDDNILPYINESIDFIKQCRGNVLVHCTAGVSRSASIVIAYLMKEKKLSYIKAFNYVQKIRPIIHPNDSFINQLKTLE